jgi:hypothetical protein
MGMAITVLVLMSLILLTGAALEWLFEEWE